LAVFFWSAPVAFRRVALETPEWTSRDSNHHRQSVSAGKTNALPTEPSGRLSQYSRAACSISAQLLDGNLTVEPLKRRPCGVVGRLPVVVRFPAGPQVSVKCGDQSKDNGAGHKKKSL